MVKTTSQKILKKNKEQKEKFLEVIQQLPTIEFACKKAGFSRQTYYRWTEEDGEFALKAEKCKAIGIATVCDVAESNIILGVKENDMRANMFWLNNNHPNYGNRPIQNNNLYITDSKKVSKTVESILNDYSKNDDTIKRKPNKRGSK